MNVKDLKVGDRVITPYGENGVDPGTVIEIKGNNVLCQPKGMGSPRIWVKAERLLPEPGEGEPLPKRTFRVDLQGVYVCTADSEEEAREEAELAPAEALGLCIREVFDLGYADPDKPEDDLDELQARFEDENRMQVALKRNKQLLAERGIDLGDMSEFTAWAQNKLIENALTLIDDGRLKLSEAMEDRDQV